MKLGIVLGMAALLTALRAGDLAITSFANGNLTWTNPVSNATYRVEWASNATGAWQRFDALTNLSAITATSSVVTVQVPMFYRVVWLDPPQPGGSYRYSGFEDGGGLVITGRVTLSVQSNAVTGTWALRQAGPANGPLGPQIGEGPLAGALNGSGLWVDLNPGWADYNVFLDGKVIGNTWTGRWSLSTLSGSANGGLFTADQVVEGGSP
jgi:hypothetical protein